MSFKFIDYNFSEETGIAEFLYEGTNGTTFKEIVTFESRNASYDTEVFERILFLCFILIGTSYYKLRPTSKVEIKKGKINESQAEFFNKVYQEGLGQFGFENKLTREDLADFRTATFGNGNNPNNPIPYRGNGILAMQSGGKDSLYVADKLERDGTEFTPWFLASGDHHPKVLDEFKKPLVIAKRTIDREKIAQELQNGGLGGHIPITYIVMSLALLQATLLGKNIVIVSVGREGIEPHSFIKDLPVNHQWSKTEEAEKLFQNYITKNISEDFLVGSPIRGMSELKIGREFVKNCWIRFGKKFSSCNVANYRQNADNSELKWCGNCPKCANLFLILSPFVKLSELTEIFAGQDLFAKSSLEHSFKGLLAVDGVEKPFECIGEVAELRKAYETRLPEYAKLNFAVPISDFNIEEDFGGNKKLKEIINS